MKAYVLSLIFCFSFIFPFLGQAQMVSVSGVVKNFHTGNAEKNVTVYESDSGIGTITNKQGYYRLLLRTGHRKIEFSGPGFNSFTTEFELTKDTVLSVDLTPLEFQNISVVEAGTMDTVQENSNKQSVTKDKRKKD